MPKNEPADTPAPTEPDQFKTAPEMVLAVLIERAQTEPILAAWIEAAQWKVAAITERAADDD